MDEPLVVPGSVDWRQEIANREDQFDSLPEEIWEAHRRVTAALH